MAKRKILVVVASLLIALGGAGSRAWAQMSGTLNQWTATAMIEQLASGDIEASVEFDDNGTGGTRRGGVCLLTNIGLGRCTTAQQCSERAVDRGLPGTGTAGWSHICIAPPTEEGTPGKHKRCWSRPGTQPDFCTLGINEPGTIRTKTRSPYGIARLDDDERDWTAVACLAGGTAPDGTAVGDALACALLTTQPDGTPLYLYVADTPLKVSGP